MKRARAASVLRKDGDWIDLISHFPPFHYCHITANRPILYILPLKTPQPRRCWIL